MARILTCAIIDHHRLQVTNRHHCHETWEFHHKGTSGAHKPEERGLSHTVWVVADLEEANSMPFKLISVSNQRKIVTSGLHTISFSPLNLVSWRGNHHMSIPLIYPTQNLDRI
jgi:hypothetical protein